MTAQLECERVKLPMVCVCRTKDTPNARKDKADALREEVKALLCDRYGSPCDDSNLVSRIVSSLYWSFSAEVEVAVDQWFGTYATVKKYVECDHAEDACPDEPDCFVYKWDAVLRVTCECDRLEDGLVSIYKWFHDNRCDEETADS